MPKGPGTRSEYYMPDWAPSFQQPPLYRPGNEPQISQSRARTEAQSGVTTTPHKYTLRFIHFPHIDGMATVWALSAKETCFLPSCGC